MSRQKKIIIIEEDEQLPNLTPFEEQFIGVLFNVGHIGSKAYKMLKPHVKDTTALTEASKLLLKPNICHAIELRRLKIRNEEDITLSYLVKELKAIISEIKPFQPVEYNQLTGAVINKKDYKSMIAAINSLAKLAGLDQHVQKIEIDTTEETTKEITININKSKK